ncbi:hypothetical protein ACR2R6_03345 [Methylocaldum gracile subsp. desertum]|uniref:hypothetical protein n=1 Tax=Methylocaldum sp. GT1BW TaxID=3438964 RepID=UPI003DA194C9
MLIFKARLAIAILGLLAVAPSHSSVVSLNLVGNAPVLVGDSFSIDLTLTQAFDGLDASDELLAFGFDTVLNGTAAQFTGVTYSPSFSDDSGLVGLDLAGSAFPGIPNLPANQTLTLATLNFQALYAGNIDLGVLGNPSEPNQGLFFSLSGPLAANAGLSLSIQSSAVPVPAAFWLFASGIAGLVVRSACRKSCTIGALSLRR